MDFFDEVDDVGYLKWYIRQLNNDRQIRCCAKAIIKAVNKKYSEVTYMEIPEERYKQLIDAEHKLREIENA